MGVFFVAQSNILLHRCLFHTELASNCQYTVWNSLSCGSGGQQDGDPEAQGPGNTRNKERN